MYNVVLTYEFVDESMTIQMKATEQYFPVVLFIMLYKVVLTFEIVNEVPIQMKATGQHFTVNSLCCGRWFSLLSKV